MDLQFNQPEFDKDRPIICPRCNRVFSGQYIVGGKCPTCGAYMNEACFVNWVNKGIEGYELAQQIAKSRELKKDEQ